MTSTLLSKAAVNDPAASSPTLERVTIPISGMTCAACQSFISGLSSAKLGYRMQASISCCTMRPSPLTQA